MCAGFAAALIVYQAPRARLDASGEARLFLVTRDQLTAPLPVGEAPLVVLEREPARCDVTARLHKGRGVGVSMSLTGSETSPE